jgi:hypothetical protein
MTDDDRPKEPGEPYAVGYGKPPKAHQFKPGRSGNPKGRPRGAKSEATLLKELLGKKMEIREGSRTRKVSTLEALLLRLRTDALKGDHKALAFLLNRYGAAVGPQHDSHDPLDQDDRQVLEAFAEKLRAGHEEKR